MRDGVAAARAVVEIRGGYVTHLLRTADGGTNTTPKLPQRCGWCGTEIRSWTQLLNAHEKWISPGMVHHMESTDQRCNFELEPTP